MTSRSARVVGLVLLAAALVAGCSKRADDPPPANTSASSALASTSGAPRMLVAPPSTVATNPSSTSATVDHGNTWDKGWLGTFEGSQADGPARGGGIVHVASMRVTLASTAPHSPVDVTIEAVQSLGEHFVALGDPAAGTLRSCARAPSSDSPAARKSSWGSGGRSSLTPLSCVVARGDDGLMTG